jgi:hypothetical protein
MRSGTGWQFDTSARTVIATQFCPICRTRRTVTYLDEDIASCSAECYLIFMFRLYTFLKIRSIVSDLPTILRNDYRYGVGDNYSWMSDEVMARFEKNYDDASFNG